MAEWPSGTVTFLFTDLEGSTQRWQQYLTAMGPALARHDRLLREAIAAQGGVVFKTIGDAVCAAFATAPAAVAAALTAQRALYTEPWGSTGPLRVRKALHTGQAEVQVGDYLGGPLNRVARLLALAHGGQVLLSGPTADLVLDYLPPGASLRDLGTHRLKDVQRPEHVFQLVVPDLPWEFPPLAASGAEPVSAVVSTVPPQVESERPARWRSPVWIVLTAVIVLAVALAAVLARQLQFGSLGRGSTSPPTLVAAVATAGSAPTASAVAPTASAAAPTPSATAPTPAATATRVVLVAPEPSPERGAPGEGRVVYTVYGGQSAAEDVYRVAAQAAATPEDLSDSLDALSPGGRDIWIDASPDGDWLVLGTERFDPECTGCPCLAVAPADLSTAEIVRVAGDVVHPGGPSAIAGDVVVIPLGDGPHETDLWAIRRRGKAWGEPLLLTGDSPYAYHAEPALSADGAWVAFECGDRPYGELGTALCEVDANGAGYRIVLEPADTPPGLPIEAALRQPAYAPDGALVFEATWDGAIWRLPPGGAPERVTPGVDKDGAPCVLPDGRVASLWLGRPGGEGRHELKVMTVDGSESIELVPGVDVEHIGCGG
jgi:class 3 adenylate cyclase